MSEHRRKPPQPGGGGRAAARRGAPGGQPPGRRAAPRDATGSPSDGYGPTGASTGGERPPGGRAEARRAAQRGGRRRAAEGPGAGGGGGRGGGRRAGGPAGAPGPGRGRGRGAPVKKRFIDYPRAGKFGWRHWVPSWRLVTGLFIGFLGSLMAIAGIAYAMVDVPDIAKTARAQNNVYYWADGSEMVATGGEANLNRQIIRYEDIPASMRNAIVSAENKTFWTDKGVDPMGVSRALVNMARGGETQGGSTITQQYVKNALLDDQSQTISRKFKELFISIKVGAQVSKQEILANYLNSAYYGRGAYGIQAAARTYFGVDASKLDASQTAFLAAILKGPTYYDPAGATSIDPSATQEANTKRATDRWGWILDQEVKDGHLKASTRATYKEFPKLQGPRSNHQLSGQVGYLVDLAKAYVINNDIVSADKLQQGGYEIHTTFDKKKVGELEDSIKKVEKEKIDPKKRPDTDKYVQFGGATVSPKTGAIQAIYGGEDATKHFTDNADATGAQVGSTFKPFVLAAAMRDGVRDPEGQATQTPDERTIVSPQSMYSGKNKLKIKQYDGSVWTNEEGKEWLQTNDGGDSLGAPPDYKITLRKAMEQSVNSAYVQLGMDVGLDKVKQSVLDAGIKENSLASSAFPSFSIGTSDPSAIRMASAYGTFAASGKQREPYSVTKVESKGDLLWKHEDKAKQAYDSNVANNVTDVLEDVVKSGTGTPAKLPDRQVAGKTGTTDGNKSAWFVGYTPQLSTAISMYRMDDNEKSKERKFLEMYGTGGEEKIHGASFPAQIWHDYMTKALKGTQPEKFEPAEEIGEVVGSAPKPSDSPSVSDSPSTSDSPSPTETEPSEPPSETPDPTDTCKGQWWGCSDAGQDGGTDAGQDGGSTTSPPPGTDDGGDDRGGENAGNDAGNDNGGGIFG
ncbi:transglycosylase domain-containing protein [Streptomyces sp. NPDC050560]|uniref:transglycosylase domain-containing protein n=1 Tax=Streptomyces sp. NPDC050560 TaxID=3365630 RepID=UPI0037A2E0C1